MKIVTSHLPSRATNHTNGSTEGTVICGNHSQTHYVHSVNFHRVVGALLDSLTSGEKYRPRSLVHTTSHSLPQHCRCMFS